MITVPPIFQLPYNHLPKTFRVLWHQTRNLILRYPEIPTKTINFDCYPLVNAKFSNQTTLGSTIATKHSHYLEDAEISEIWTADDLSIKTGFFYYLRDFFNSQLESSEYLIWYPKDKTDKAFAIQPLKLTAGNDENELDINPVHSRRKKNYQWLQVEIKFTFKVLRIINAPDAVVLLEGY